MRIITEALNSWMYDVDISWTSHLDKGQLVDFQIFQIKLTNFKILDQNKLHCLFRVINVKNRQASVTLQTSLTMGKNYKIYFAEV